MRKSRFTDEQKIAILQQAAGVTAVLELCRLQRRAAPQEPGRRTPTEFTETLQDQTLSPTQRLTA